MTPNQVIGSVANHVGSVIGQILSSSASHCIQQRLRKELCFGIIIAMFLLHVNSDLAHAQAGGFEIGDDVVVTTDGSSLNLREGAGRSYPTIAKMPNGTVVKIVGGPEIADGYQWWEVEGTFGRGWAAGNFLKPVSGELLSNSEVSAESEHFDWRRNLVCPPDREVYQGMEYCEGKDGIGLPIHVVVIDLRSSGIAVEYILPKGYSDGFQGLQICQDPNVPAWAGPARGCFVKGDRSLYPTMSIVEAAGFAREVRDSPQPAVIINADYGAPNRTHGPEGLLVVQYERFDGIEKCDDDYNAALRPWLGIGDGLDPAAGRLLAAIDRLEKDTSSVPEWIYTGIGGGPLLIRNGQLVPGSSSCAGGKELQVLEPVVNCTGNDKTPKPTPLLESYNGGSCRPAPHTAVGISRDKRWLFFVVSTSNRDPGTIAKFMLEELGVWTAMKFDGGGSSQMLFLGPPEILIYPENVDRKLTNFLALYAPQGKGIDLPLEAEPIERVSYSVVIEGEIAQVQLEVLNSGTFTWNSEDGVELREEPWSLLLPVVDSLPLSSAIPPGETAVWNWEANTSGVMVRRFQMYQKDNAFGPEIAVIVVVVPKEMADKKEEIEQKIQEMIDDWKARGEQELDELIKQIQDWALREISSWLDGLGKRICGGFGFIAAILFFGLISKHYYLRH